MPAAIILLSIPFLELYFLIQLGGAVGAVPTLAWCLITGAAGAAVLRLQGLAIHQVLTTSLERQEPMAAPLLDGMLVVLGGIGLVLPGLITDVGGTLLLLPPLRRLLVRRMTRGLPVPHGDADRGPSVIEGDYRRED